MGKIGKRKNQISQIHFPPLARLRPARPSEMAASVGFQRCPTVYRRRTGGLTAQYVSKYCTPSHIINSIERRKSNANYVL